MKNKLLTLSLIVLFALSTITLISSVQVKAETSSPTNQWITSYTIADSSGTVIQSSTGAGSGYISTGEELQVTVTINVVTQRAIVGLDSYNRHGAFNCSRSLLVS